MDSWFKLQVIELGFRTNPNKSWCLGCVWVITHIRVVWNVMKDELSKIEISRCIVNGFEVYMKYRVELGRKIWEKKMQKSPHSGQNSSTCTGTCNALFSNFDQFLYFSHNLLIYYPI